MAIGNLTLNIHRSIVECSQIFLKTRLTLYYCNFIIKINCFSRSEAFTELSAAPHQLLQPRRQPPIISAAPHQLLQPRRQPPVISAAPHQLLQPRHQHHCKRIQQFDKLQRLGGRGRSEIF